MNNIQQYLAGRLSLEELIALESETDLISALASELKLANARIAVKDNIAHKMASKVDDYMRHSQLNEMVVALLKESMTNSGPAAKDLLSDNESMRGIIQGLLNASGKECAEKNCNCIYCEATRFLASQPIQTL